MPSIFSNEGANSRIRDANSEESEISAREEDEEEEPDYDNSLILAWNNHNWTNHKRYKFAFS